ncbi:hypothetical protein LCGC14_0297660 [marine sediment metagenome]|uniref:Uncharacterized protein n=1 Tax=marine sediment metagenome TaxID=412755 RepID=A0A0F9U843_9ZZZZ
MGQRSSSFWKIAFVWVVIGVLLGTLIYPPWKRQTGHSVGYGWLWIGPLGWGWDHRGGGHSYQYRLRNRTSLRIDTTRLLLQWAVVFLLAGGLACTKKICQANKGETP